MPSQFTTINKVAILSTGSEILQGLYADKNGQYLAEQLSRLGLIVVSKMTAPDDCDLLEDALRYLTTKADLIVCSGGLGPTEDDINRDVISKVFSAKLVSDFKAITAMKARFAARDRGPMPPSNETQAMVPEGSIVFQNEWGTAPGFFLPPLCERKPKSKTRQPCACCLIALPGPPKEMRPMFEKHVIPLLAERSNGNSYCRTMTVHTFGQAESYVNEKVSDLFRLDPAIGFSILAKPYGVDLRITARSLSEAGLDKQLHQFDTLIRERLSPLDIYGIDADTLSESTARLLILNEKTVSFAESCTGGLVCKLLTDVAGCAVCLSESYVTYSNEAKQRLAGVNLKTLREHGAVSEQVAQEMAIGIRKVAKSDYAAAVTGIAGPTGATDNKPVGLTYIAITGPHHTSVTKFTFLGDREQNRLWAALSTLDLVRRMLLKDLGC